MAWQIAHLARNPITQFLESFPRELLQTIDVGQEAWFRDECDLEALVVARDDDAQAEIGRARRDEIAALCVRRGLTLPEPHFEQLCATAPYVEEMVGHLSRAWAFMDEPASVFQFGG